MADMSGEIPIDTPKKLQVFKELKARGLSSAAIAGIMGNIDVETGGSFNYEQKQIKGPGYGLFQFTGSHKRDYMDWLKKSDLDDGKNSQAKFVYDNIYGSKGYGRELGWRDRSKLQTILEEDMTANPHIDDPTTRKAKTFSDVYEKPSVPHNERRMLSAKEWEEKYK